MPKKKKKPIINPGGLLRGVHQRSERQREILEELFPEDVKKRKKKKKG